MKVYIVFRHFLYEFDIVLRFPGYTVHSMIDRYANGGITMAYSQPIADVLREFFVLSNIDAGFEEQAGCGVFTFRTKLHCRLQTAQMLVLVREDNFSTLTTIPSPPTKTTAWPSRNT